MEEFINEYGEDQMRRLKNNFKNVAPQKTELGSPIEHLSTHEVANQSLENHYFGMG
jgi:hypothetical protein